MFRGMIEARKNKLSSVISSLSDEELCTVFEEITDFKNSGILAEHSNLAKIAVELHEKFKVPYDIRMVEDDILYEAARRFYNLSKEDMGIPQFGDVIYRPCISYAGRKHFVNTQIVKGILHREDGDYILSYDIFNQSWTDKVMDLGHTIFTCKSDANDKLMQMVTSK